MSSSLQPTLNGERLQLRPLRSEDFEPLYQAASDPLIWEQHPQNTRYQRDVFAAYFEGAMQSKGALIALERSTGAVMGSSRYYDRRPEERRLTIGYTFLARAFWGGSVNREMKSLMLGHAFRLVDKVFFEVGETNHRSKRALEKIGARVFEHRTLDGNAHVVYVIEAQEFRGRVPESPRT
jgi:RimJ/RimL family protein N-acetyltransferase